jgi:hypothetical protein
MTHRRSPGTIPATADNALKAQAVLRLMCANCDREKKADLAAIIQRGLGERPDQRFEVPMLSVGSAQNVGDGDARDMTGRSIAGWGIVDGVGLALG